MDCNRCPKSDVRQAMPGRKRCLRCSVRDHARWKEHWRKRMARRQAAGKCVDCPVKGPVRKAAKGRQRCKRCLAGARARRARSAKKKG